MNTASNRTAATALAFLLTAGCASAPQNASDNSNEVQVVGPASDRGYKAKRLVTKGAHLGWVTARSIYEGGMLRRTAIATVQMPALSDEIPEVSYAQPMDLDAFEKVLDKVTGTRSDTGQIKFLVDGDEYFCRLAAAVQNAEESIDIRTYIFDNDDYAVEFADTLKERSDDVRVRVMIDGVGNMMAMQADPESMPTGYEGPLSMRMYMERESDVKVRNITNPWLTIGDHTKTTIIDKKIAFVGGMNIGREYRYDWHDLMMEVSGPVVQRWLSGPHFTNTQLRLRYPQGTNRRHSKRTKLHPDGECLLFG